MRTVVTSVDNTVCMASRSDDPGTIYVYFDLNDEHFRCISIDELVKMVRTIVASQQ